MKNIRKKLGGCFKKVGLGVSAALLSSAVFAEDKLAGAMSGQIRDTLGGQGTFWKAFILIDIILGMAAFIKTKNPIVLVSVLLVAVIPAYLLDAFVFQGI